MENPNFNTSNATKLAYVAAFDVYHPKFEQVVIDITKSLYENNPDCYFLHEQEEYRLGHAESECLCDTVLEQKDHYKLLSAEEAKAWLQNEVLPGDYDACEIHYETTIADRERVERITEDRVSKRVQVHEGR